MSVIRAYTDNQWVRVLPQNWNGFYWAMNPPADAGTIYQSAWYPNYLAEGTVFTRSVADMPLAANSADLAAWMVANSPLPANPPAWTGGFGAATSLNTVTYNIPVYLVDSTVPGCEMQRPMTVGGLSAGSPSYGYLSGNIPLPYWATPAPSGDKSMAIYDIGTGIMRDYFLCTNTGFHQWTASTGGYYVAEKGLASLAATNYAMQLTAGSSSVVGMMNGLSQIGIAEARGGVINHAVSFTMANAAEGVFSWPARGDDGLDTSGNAPAEGQWFRLPADLDISSYKPFTQLIIKACQTYGGFGADKNLFVNAFNTEPPQYELHTRGLNPWAQNGELAQIYAAPGDYGSIEIDDFPWSLTEWAPINWGKPT